MSNSQDALPPLLQFHLSSFLNSLSSPEQSIFTSKFNSNYKQVLCYEKEETLTKARALLPTHELELKAKERNERDFGDSKDRKIIQECYIRELMRWFKHEFFSWVDAPPCQNCNKETKFYGMDKSQKQERVELYKCSFCNSITPFTRYNDPEILLSTRKGRCGEWANAFTLFCRASGFPARLILDFTDHVWTEVYIGKLNSFPSLNSTDTISDENNDGNVGDSDDDDEGNWIHCDACEEKYNTPLLYERGWNKQLTYIFAFSVDEIKDVTLRYTNKWNEVQSRRKEIKEELLSFQITLFNQKIQNNFNDTKKDLILRRGKKENELFQLKLQNKFQQSQLNSGELEGRISGSTNWRAARGELGNNNNNSNNNNNNNQNINEIDSFKEAIITSLYYNHLVFAFKEFKESQRTLSLNGDCKILQNFLQLTPKSNDKRSSVWWKKQLPIHCNFQTQFQFQVLSPGADGFAFVIQREGPQALGKGGSDLGYGGITRSLAIEFDMYDSYDTCEDPNGNHISVQSRGKLPNSPHHENSLICVDNPGVQLNDQKIHSVKISYYCDQESPADSILSLELDSRNLFFINLDILSLLNDDSGNDMCWFGFTAATGGLSQEHRILSWSHFLSK